MKTTIITALLMLAMVRGAVAQEKYHFAIITLPYNGNYVRVVTDETEKLIDLDKKLDASGRLKVLLMEVSKMTDEGWEVINVSQDVYVVAYNLKKKK